MNVLDLIKKLKSRKVAERRDAVLALGEIELAAKDTIPALILTSLADSNETVRQTAKKVLGQVGAEAKDILPELVKHLESRKISVRKNALQTLGEIGPEVKDTTPDLMKILESSNKRIREIAAEILSKIAPVKAFQSFGLSAHGSEILVKNGILDLDQLIEKTRNYDQILAFNGCDSVTANEIFSFILRIIIRGPSRPFIKDSLTHHNPEVRLITIQHLKKTIHTFLRYVGLVRNEDLEKLVTYPTTLDSLLIFFYRRKSPSNLLDDDEVLSRSKKLDTVKALHQLYGKGIEKILKCIDPNDIYDDFYSVPYYDYSGEKKEKEEVATTYAEQITTETNNDLVEWEDLELGDMSTDILFDIGRRFYWSGFTNKEIVKLEGGRESGWEVEEKYLSRTVEIPLLHIRVSEKKWNGLSNLPISFGEWSENISTTIKKKKFTSYADIAVVTKSEWVKFPLISETYISEIRSEIRKAVDRLKINLKLLNRMTTKEVWSQLKNHEIRDVSWSKRLKEAFEKHKISNLGELAELTGKQILQWEGIGEKSLEEIQFNVENYIKWSNEGKLLNEQSQQKIEQELIDAVFE